METIAIPISELSLDPANARKHSKKNLDAIKGSLRRFGQQKPVVVDRNNVVIAGNGTLEAAKALGWESVAIVRSDLVGSDRTAYALADNRTTDLGEWDDEVLGAQLQALFEENFDIGDIGFDPTELLPTSTPEQDEKEDDVPETELNELGVERGQVWTLGRHRLMCGDSTARDDVVRLMSGVQADMVFTDPPYGVSYEQKTQEIFGQTDRYRKIENDDLKGAELETVIRGAFENINYVLHEKGSYYICSPQGGDLGLMMMMMMKEAGIVCRHMCIWVKNAPVFSMGRLDYDYKHEPILYGWKKSHQKSSRKGKWNSSVWDCAREPNKLHPTMKPVELVENAIVNSCPPGGVLFEPFGGSGSTIIACEKTNRVGYAMEIDPHYCSVIIKRWQDYSGNKAGLALA